MKLKELLQTITNIQNRLGTSPAYVCGGTPRDKVLNKLKDISDLDITTGDKSVNNIAEELSLALKRVYTFQFKKMPDGHSSIFLGNLKVDFSSNFIAPGIETHLSKLGIKKSTSLQQEMFSRDFTCNALLMSMDLKNILDPTGRGFKDIEERKIKTCLSPEVTFSSINKNRVVRAIYLGAKLDFDLDKDIVEWIRRNPESIRLSSDNFITQKLNKAMDYNPEKTVYLINQLGLWNYIPIGNKLYPFYKQQKVIK